MQYVSPEQLSAAQNRGHFDETMNDDLTRSDASITDSISGPDHLKEAEEEEDENSCSAPLCINFPSIKVSRERLPSQSSVISPQAEVAMSAEANSGRQGKPDLKLRRKDAGNGDSLPVGWKSNSYCAEAYQSNTTLPNNKRNLEEAKANCANFISNCSAMADASKSVVYANNKEMTNFCTEKSEEHPYQSYKTMRQKGEFAGEELPTWTWNGPVTDRLQHTTDSFRPNTTDAADPRCMKYAEASSQHVKALKRSFAASNLYPEGPSCSSQNGLQPRTMALPERVGPEKYEVDVNLGPSAKHHAPVTDVAFSNPDRRAANHSPTFGVVSPSASSSSETTVHPLSAEGDARLYRSPQALFGHLVTAFRELEEISRRVCILIWSLLGCSLINFSISIKLL